MFNRLQSEAKELWVVMLVAVGVALAATVVASAFDRVHQVSAEDLAVRTGSAKAAGSSQVLTIPEWGVSLTMQLDPAMPLVKYAYQDASSVGFSSEDLVKLGSACAAQHDALGALLRLPAGQFGTYASSRDDLSFVATVNGHDYAYIRPSQNQCSSYDGAPTIINREWSVLTEALGSLAPSK